jgi:hypothetical protein
MYHPKFPYAEPLQRIRYLQWAGDPEDAFGQKPVQ